MKFSEILLVAWQSVRSNLLRSGLTMSIIGIGIMALVGILTALDCALYSLNESFNDLGSNSFSIERKFQNLKGQKRGVPRMKLGEAINYAQAIEFKERFEFPARVTIAFAATSSATMQHGEKKTNPTISITGVDNNYLIIKGYEIEYGRNFSDAELESGVNKVILGREIIKLLFNDEPSKALGQDVLIGGVRYQILGILKSKGAAGSGGGDRLGWIPLLNAKKNYDANGADYIINVGASNAADLEAASSFALGLFRQIRRTPIGKEEDFEITKSDGLIDVLKENTVYLRLSTVIIGLITLVGAAIGLMNIMLVSVTERTREIGISKALGATQKVILTQFLTEAIIICQLGGAIGVILGILMGNIVSLLLGGSFIIPWAWITLGVVTCLIVGLVSGLYPALKASRLDPIESLRYE